MQPLTEQTTETITVTIGATAATVLVVGRAVRCYGFTLRETTGVAAADVDLIAGVDGNGDVLATVTLAAGQSVRDLTGLSGVYCDDGIALKVNAGSVRGAVWVSYQS